MHCAEQNKTESKMENPTYSFRGTNLVLHPVLHLIQQSQIIMQARNQEFFRAGEFSSN